MSNYKMNTCLTLNTFICQRKIQIMIKKKTTFKKCANVGRGKHTKSWWQILKNSKQFSPVTMSTDSQGIAKNTTLPPSGLE